MPNKVNDIVMENAKIIFRNFSGKEKKYNPAGRRNFCVIIEDEELVRDLIADGWNVKHTKPTDPDQDPVNYIQVTVSYDHIPPKIYMATSKNKILLDANSVGELDWAEIKNVDLVIHPSIWEVNGKYGVKAYAKNMVVTIEEDPFADKYKHLKEMSKSDTEEWPF